MQSEVIYRVTPEQIQRVIIDEEYIILNGRKTMICQLTLQNGFKVRGEANIVDPEYFKEEVGRQISRQDAEGKIWPLEGYLAQQRKYEAELCGIVVSAPNSSAFNEPRPEVVTATLEFTRGE